MWILTSFGAFMPAMRPIHTIAEGDDKVIQIRARRRVDLNRMRRFYMPDLGPTYTVPGSDYQYRANCTRMALAVTLHDLAYEIDYVSFKDTTTAKWGDNQLHRAYLQVWGALAGALGNRRPGGSRKPASTR